MNNERLNWDFDYHAPSPECLSDRQTIRVRIRTLAGHINDIVPDCREKSLAITKLEEAMFWAIAAVDHQDRPEDAQ